MQNKHGVLPYEVRQATRIKVDIDGDLTDYAKSFLAIYNNVKSDHDLLKIYNDYGSNVYVVCESSVTDSAIQFLEQFGEIKKVETVDVVQPIGDDYNYSTEMDTEFIAASEI